MIYQWQISDPDDETDTMLLPMWEQTEAEERFFSRRTNSPFLDDSEVRGPSQKYILEGGWVHLKPDVEGSGWVTPQHHELMVDCWTIYKPKQYLHAANVPLETNYLIASLWVMKEYT